MSYDWKSGPRVVVEWTNCTGNIYLERYRTRLLLKQYDTYTCRSASERKRVEDGADNFANAIRSLIEGTCA